MCACTCICVYLMYSIKCLSVQGYLRRLGCSEEVWQFGKGIWNKPWTMGHISFFLFYGIALKSFLKKMLFIYLFSGRGVGGEKEREKNMAVREKHLTASSGGPGLQPRHVPGRGGNEMAPFRFTGRHTVHWAPPAGERLGHSSTGRLEMGCLMRREQGKQEWGGEKMQSSCRGGMRGKTGKVVVGGGLTTNLCCFHVCIPVSHACQQKATQRDFTAVNRQ